tara:strand:+ start:3057 stop:3239 length:183 start_codon:yes stop_codon:yes gene_type:complete
MDSAYSRYLDIIDNELVENIEKLTEIQNWIEKRLEDDRLLIYSDSHNSIKETIKHLKANL